MVIDFITDVLSNNFTQEKAMCFEVVFTMYKLDTMYKK